MVKSVSDEYQEIIKRAQEQPGIAELMQAYGRYDEFIKKANEYLSTVKPKRIISTAGST